MEYEKIYPSEDMVRNERAKYIDIIVSLVATIFVLFLILIFSIVMHCKTIEKIISISQNVCEMETKNAELEIELEYYREYSHQLEEMIQQQE